MKIKKFLSVAVALLIMLVSAVPAFAVSSPVATVEYKVNMHLSNGGTGSYKFTTGINENGEQGVYLEAETKDGYKFENWVIEGPYSTKEELTSESVDIIITGDIDVTPMFSSKDASATQPSSTAPVVTDDSSKSPQTGNSNAVLFIVLIGSLTAAAVAVKFLKTSREK